MILKSRQSWPEIAASEHSPEGLPRPISMLSFTLPPENQVVTHSHSWGQLMYAERGIIMVMLEGNACVTTQQKAVWIPPGVEHSVSSLEGAQLSSVYIDGDEVLELPRAPSLIRVNTLLRTMIERAVQIPPNYEWCSPDGRFMRVLRDEVMRSERDIPELPMPQDARIDRICQQLQKSPGDKRSLKQWGRVWGHQSVPYLDYFAVNWLWGFASGDRFYECLCR